MMQDASVPLLPASGAWKSADASLNVDWRTMVNLCKCFAGAASFELPYALSQSGLITGVIGILLLAVASHHTILLLARCGRMVPGKEQATYVEIGEYAYGKAGRIAAWFGILTVTIVGLGAYVVFIASTMADLLGVAIWLAVLVMCPIGVALALMRSYKILAPFSTIGFVALTSAVLVTMGDALSQHDPHPISQLSGRGIERMPIFVGNAAFLYLIHTVVLPVEQSMADPRQFRRSLTLSMTGVTVLNVLFAAIAYVWYGPAVDNPQGNVLFLLKPGAITTLVKLFLCLDLLMTTPLFLIPTIELLEKQLFDPATFGQDQVERKRNLLRGSQFIVITAVALGIPNFSTMTGLSGVVGNSILGFILPPLFYMRLKKLADEPLTRFDKLVCWSLLSWGVIVFILGIVSYAQEIARLHRP